MVSGTVPGFKWEGARGNWVAKGSAPVRGSGDILPLKIFIFQVLGNAISAILRQSQGVLMSHFFKSKNTSLFHINITSYVKTCKFSLIKLWWKYHYAAFHLISILCFFKDGIDVQQVFFRDIFPQKAVLVTALKMCTCSFIEKQRFNLVMNFLHLRLTVFI